MQRLASRAFLLQMQQCCTLQPQAVQGFKPATNWLLDSVRVLQVQTLHASALQQPCPNTTSRSSGSSGVHLPSHLHNSFVGSCSHTNWWSGTTPSSSSIHNSSQSSSSSSSSLRHFSSSSASAASRTFIPGLRRRTPAAASKALAQLEQSNDEQANSVVGVCRRRQLKCGWKKIDFVLRMIRRATVDDAMAQLAASPKRAAVFVRHAVANARNNAIYAGGDPQKLYVAEAYVTKGRYTKRLNIMSKGFASMKETQYSHLNVRVQQYGDEAAAAALLKRRPRLVAPLMQRLHDRARTPRRLLVPPGLGGSSTAAGQLAQL